jgi:hypothetical protein
MQDSIALSKTCKQNSFSADNGRNLCVSNAGVSDITEEYQYVEMVEFILFEMIP